MNRISLGWTMPAVSLAALLAVSPVAFAQQQQQQPGVTSGPAAGSTVTPNTAVPKQEGTSSAAQPGAIGAGAPGQAAKPGVEAGPASGPSTSGSGGATGSGQSQSSQ